MADSENMSATDDPDGNLKRYWLVSGELVGDAGALLITGLV